MVERMWWKWKNEKNKVNNKKIRKKTMGRRR